MNRKRHWLSAPKDILFGLLLVITMSCTPPVERPKGWGKVYEDGKELFARSDFRRALGFVRDVAMSEPSHDYTARGLVLSIILSSGSAQGYQELAEAYQAGTDKLEDPKHRSEYRRLRQDSYQYARTHALQLAEVARRLVEFQDKEEMKDLIVECPYPSAEASSANQPLEHAKEGSWIPPEERRKAQLIAIRMQIRRSLAAALGVEAAETSDALRAGTAKVSNIAFNLYLAKELLVGTKIFSTQGLDEGRNLVIMCEQANESVKQALKILGAAPNQGYEKTARDLQKKIGKTMRAAGYRFSGAN